MKKNQQSIRRIVVKIGSSVLSGDSGLKAPFFSHLAGQVLVLKEREIETVIVSSGAVAAAMAAFGVAAKPKRIPEKQAFAAYGQPLLMKNYIAAFRKKGLDVAQILLTHPDLENRNRFLNARQVLSELLARGIVPVVNENDSVAVEELKFGDNDRLSAYVANLVEADLLIILSHVDGLYDGDPEKNSASRLIETVERVDDGLRGLVFEGGNARGTGGMASKLEAAETCMEFGIPIFITNGGKSDCLVKTLDGVAVGTRFQPSLSPMGARKHWIGRVLKSHGDVTVDDGAKEALTKGKRSLLASGILAVTGRFDHGDCVTVRDREGLAIAKGLVSYAAWEIEKIRGRKSSEIEKILGYKVTDEVIHRDDLVVS